MSLRPLANLLAVGTLDPGELGAVRERIEASGAFDPTWDPAPGRLVAVSRFSGSSPDDEPVRAAGLAFAQGRDELAACGRRWEEIAHLVAERPESLDQLPGDFGLVQFRPSGEVTVVRSAGGLVPFYVADDGERWTVATTLAHLLRFHPGELALDPLVNAILTSGYDAAPDRRTFVAGVRLVGRGEYVRLDGGRAAFGRWWDPRQGAAPRPAADHAERLRSALLATLERDLAPEGENLLALSGGVDSSAVGALAAGTLGREVSTLTVLSDDEAARARDRRYVDALTEAVGFRRRKMVVVDRERRLALLDEPRVPFHVPMPYLCLLPSVADEWPVSVLVGGEFADHTVGSALTLRDWARHTTLSGLWGTRRALPTGPADIRRWFVYRLRRALRRPPVPWPGELPSLVRPELRDQYRDWLRDRRRAAAHDDGPMPYLAMFLERQGFLGMHWEVTSSLGVRRSFPFVTRELLELGFECHPSELVGPGTKRLLRAALAGDVPAVNLERPDKGRPRPPGGTEFRAWSGEIPSVLEPILAPGWPPRSKIAYWDVHRGRQLVAFAKAFERSRGGR
ncbi:MAG TPA: asparagine synthase-related protein [Solirubrobacterales bacterium]|nr:asparagine synthase-related protein [Solirubrobacterales bacterium]